MTATLGLNASNDLYLGGDGNLVLLTGLQAVLAACATASKAQLGEMVLSLKQGIPNFQALWVGSPNIPLWQSKLRATLLSVDGVSDVTDLQINQVGNDLKYTATIKTIFGDGVLNV